MMFHLSLHENKNRDKMQTSSHEESRFSYFQFLKAIFNSKFQVNWSVQSLCLSQKNQTQMLRQKSLKQNSTQHNTT